MCVREIECEGESVCERASVWESERASVWEIVCGIVRVWEREYDSVGERVSVCERGRVCVREGESECV